MTDKKLTYDFPKQMLRLTMGDVTMRTIGFQSSQAVGGFSLNKNFLLQPYLSTSPEHNLEIFLDKPSTVEVYVNDVVTKSLKLAAGTHQLIDVPASYPGLNEIKIKIIDSFGNVSWIEDEFMYDSALLKKGVEQYSCNFGFRSQGRDDGVSYDKSEPLFSCYHRYGYTKSLTLGTYFQLDRRQTLAGIESLYSFSPGQITFDAALSTQNRQKFDYAARLAFRNYTSFTALFSKDTTWNLNLIAKGEKFAGIGQIEANNTVSLDCGGSISRRINDKLSLSLQGNYRFRRDEKYNPYNTGLSFNYTLPGGLSSNLNISHNRSDSNILDTQFVINFSWSLANSGNSLAWRYGSRSRTKSVNWSYSSDSSQHSTSYGLGLSQNPSSDNINANLNYTHNRGILRMTHATSNVRPQGGTGNASTFTLSSALVYAGGRFGITRPVSNSFAIFSTNDLLKGKELLINPAKDSYAAKNDIFGTAVLNGLTPYQMRDATVIVPNLPMGYDIGKSVYNLFPTNRSGIAVTIGTNSTLMLDGKLSNTDGTFIPYEAGEVTKIDDESWGPKTFFTNRKGKFRILGLNPGSFRIKLYSDAWEALELTIPKGTTGIYKIGIITLAKNTTFDDEDY